MNQCWFSTIIDPLTELQLRVARRADEIARGQPGLSGLSLQCWLLAEREIFHATPDPIVARQNPNNRGGAEERKRGKNTAYIRVVSGFGARAKV